MLKTFMVFWIVLSSLVLSANPIKPNNVILDIPPEVLQLVFLELAKAGNEEALDALSKTNRSLHKHLSNKSFSKDLKHALIESLIDFQFARSIVQYMNKHFATDPYGEMIEGLRELHQNVHSNIRTLNQKKISQYVAALFHKDVSSTHRLIFHENDNQLSEEDEYLRVSLLTFIFSKVSLEQIKKILAQKENLPNINFQKKKFYFSDNQKYLTPLMKAVSVGKHSLAQLLLEKGASQNLTDDNGNSALHLAAMHGREEIIKTLLKYKPNINLQNLRGETALFMATSSGYEKVSQIILLSHGADPSIKDWQDRSVLMLAGELNQTNLVQELLESLPKFDKDFSPAEKNAELHSAMHIALMKGHFEMFQTLYHACEGEYQGEDEHALFLAAKYTLHNFMDFLIENHVNVNCKEGSFQKTPLMCAREASSLEKLIDAGAKVDQKDLNGLTAFMHQVLNGNKECADFLLTKGADPHATDKLGNHVFDLLVKLVLESYTYPDTRIHTFKVKRLKFMTRWLQKKGIKL